MNNYIDKIRSTANGQKSLRQESFILEVTEIICKLMKKHEVSISELAKRMERSTGRINDILEGENLTLRTLSDIFDALGYKVIIDVKPILLPKRKNND